MTMVELMALPFAECLILVGIHSYLGIHVLKRKVIFVDLAFAQIAALGTTVAYLFHLQPTGPGAYLFSLLFTFLAAAVFAITRLREERIPQEAVIGLTYALAAAAAILVIDRAPHGAEHIKDIMAGSILWVRGGDVAVAAVVYSLVGLFHYVFREKFLLISTDADEARAQGINVRLWDFLFYVSFGIVISLSVRVAGVLLVFVFLIVPAMLGVLITARLGLQLVIGWGMGTLVSVAGLWLSDRGDFPAGPAVVSLYGVVLMLAAVVLWVVRAGTNRGRNLARTGVGTVVAVVVVAGLYLLGTALGASDFWVFGGRRPGDHVHGPLGAAAHAQADRDDELLDDKEEFVVDDKLSKLGKDLVSDLNEMDIVAMEEHLKTIEDRTLLQEAFAGVESDEVSFALARRLFELCPRMGGEALLAVMGHSDIPMFRSEALDIIAKVSGQDFGFDPFEDPGAKSNQAALVKAAQWAGGVKGKCPTAGGRGRKARRGRGAGGHRHRHGQQ